MADEVAGLRISHGERAIFDDPPLTKLDLARYFAVAARWMLPHVAGRPLTLLRCEGRIGVEGCTFLRHAKAWGPAVLRRVRIPEKTKVGEYLVADSEQALVALAQMGVVEVHTWNTRAGDVERPDRLVFDLDPGDAVRRDEIVAAAFAVRDALAALELESWVKSTGGRGLHVVAPIRPRRPWDECLAFTRAFAEVVAASAPDRFTVAYARHGRERKILLDYLRNNRTNTSVAAYSPRARPGAPVSWPLSWGELGRASNGPSVPEAAARLARRRRDPWAGAFACGQELTAAAIAAVTRRRRAR